MSEPQIIISLTEWNRLCGIEREYKRLTEQKSHTNMGRLYEIDDGLPF